LKIEKKKVRFDRFESPWRDIFFDPSRPILWEPLLYGVENRLFLRIMCGIKGLNPFFRLHEATEVLYK